MSRNHRLFTTYPLRGSTRTSCGELPTPYHIYDGNGVLIGGTADLGKVQDILKNEEVSAVQTSDGRTLMAIWICNFTDASLGPHHELQFSFFVSRKAIAPLSSHAFSVITMMTHPDVHMMCHGLWNNVAAVVAYNRELLNLNARLANSHIENQHDTLAFAFQDRTTNSPLISGKFARIRRVSLRAHSDLVRYLGLRQSWNMMRQPWLRMKIVHPVGAGSPRNGVAETFTKNDINLVRFFDRSKDHLTIREAPYGHLGFEPQFAQYMSGFKFVYLEPK